MSSNGSSFLYCLYSEESSGITTRMEKSCDCI